MSRPWLETVEPYPKLDAKRSHRCAVLRAEKQRRPRAMVVKLRHLDGAQAGRVHDISLPLPIHPTGSTCEFLAACGLDLPLGAKVSPQDAVGAIIKVRFAGDESDAWRPMNFEADERSHPHDEHAA